MEYPERRQILKKLQSLNEKAFTDKILLPLLEKLGFDSIEQRHGPYEKGIDILCIKRDELEEIDLLTIQVKKLKFSGSSKEPGHLHSVINQLSQCLEEPIKLKDGTERLSNRVWLISPYPLNISSLESSFAKYIKAGANRIRIVDGDTFVSILYKKAPEILAQLGDRYASYLRNIEKDIIFIQESSAFRLKDKVALLPIYINLDMSVLPHRIFALLNDDIQQSAPQKVSVKMSEVESWIKFGLQANELLGANPLILVEDPRINLPSSSENIKAIFKVNRYAFYNSIKKKVNQKIITLKQGMNVSKKVPGSALFDFHSFINSLESLLNHSAVNWLLGPLPMYSSSNWKIERINISVDELLESRLNFQVIGQPGAGKTTLLRILCYKEAVKRTGRLPLFIPLSNMTDRGSLLGLIQRSFSLAGLSTTKKSLSYLLENGSLLLLLDGIDEAIARVKNIYSEIDDFMSKYKSTQCIFTTRPWACMERNPQLFTVHILPLTKEQVITFFNNWFVDNPLHPKEIIAHLETHPDLYEIISTPLIATIFAVVKSFGGNLPTSLLELHEERLRLLLHDWDSVKGVKRDLFKVKDKLFFLRKFAFDLHSKSIRMVSWEYILQLILKTVGEIRSRTEAEDFAVEIVQNNNMLFQDADDKWGLAHLQYQEYLSALEAKENPRIRLTNFLGDGWWSSVIRMYAEMTRDISYLIYDCDNKKHLNNEEELLLVLRDLLSLAPNTEDKAKQIIEKECEIMNAVRHSFSRYSDADILFGKGKPRLK